VKAIAHLREAVALAAAIGLPGERWQIQAALGELHDERGEREAARAAFTQAAAIVRGLADRINNDALRADFLSAPQVRRVLGY
jgi:Flp pilus assembly protein TadD